MKINKGLYQDIRPHDQPQGTYPFGKNGIQDYIKNVVFNEPGHNIDPAVVPYPVRGVIEVDRGRAVIFTTDGVTSEIGYYDRNTNAYSKIIGDGDLTDNLDFGLDHWITGEFQRNFKDEVLVTFTDKDEFPKILNCDVPGVTSAEQMRLFLNFEPPTISTEVITGGSLERGGYFIGVKYLLNDGSATDLATISKPVAITSDNVVGNITDKAITITLSELDQSFDKIQLFFISRINGIFKALAGPELEITPTTVVYTLTGEELFEVITLEEIVIPGARYSKVGTMGQLNDALYLADLEKEPEINLQKYANIVRVKVKSELIDILATIDPDHADGTHKGLMHQEVYALYIRYRITGTGRWTKFFHIPGLAPTGTDNDIATDVHGAYLSAREFQIHDTIHTFNSTTKVSDTGVWINQNETYPTTDSFDSTSIGGEDLRGTSVRHHKMPSVAFVRNQYWFQNTYAKTQMDILSLEISNVILPADLITTIDAYEIGIAKRTPNNSLIIGQSLLLLAAQPTPYENGLDHVGSTGGNWHSNTIDTPGSGATADFSTAKALRVTGRHLTGLSGLGTQTPVPGLRFRFHSFDVLFNSPAIAPTYFSPQLLMRVDGLEDEDTGFLEDGELGGNRVPVMGIIDYTGANADAVINTDNDVNTRVIEKSQYLPNNVNTGEYNNIMLERAFVGKMRWIGSPSAVADNDVPLDIPFVTVNKADNQEPGQRFHSEETYLTNLVSLKGDLYNSFYAQTIYASGETLDIANATNTTYPGDIFVSPYSFHTYGWFDAENHPGNDAINPNTDGGYKIVRRFLTEAVSNVNLRFEIAGNIYSQWWPHNPLTPQPVTPDGYLYQFDRAIDPNQFGYTKDLNAFADFLGLDVYNPYFVDVTQFPYRIQRGGKLPKTGKIRSWRNFLPLDFYDMQKNMGRINRVVGMNDKLIIHTENAIFRTQDKMKLEADILSVTLGTGDIFQFEPQQTFDTKQGYAGTQHELAAVLTPIGYIFVDAKMGEVYLFRDGLKMINEGMSIFLRQYLKEVADQKNVFAGNGITIGYDPDYKRVLLTVKNQQLTTGLEDFVPNYVATAEFFDTLVEGVSIVYKDGRYQRFLGVNNPELTSVDCPTNPPPSALCEGATTMNVDEASAVNTIIGSVTGLFSDNVDDILQYTIQSGNIDGVFFLDQLSGVLKVADSSLNFDSIPEYTLVVRATDSNQQYVECTVIVEINNVHQPAVLIPGQEFIVCDDTTDANSVGFVATTSPEAGTITYDIDYGLSGAVPFIINNTTGEITTDGTIDIGDGTSYTIHIIIHHDNGDDIVDSTGTVHISITICEVDTPVEFSGYGVVSAPDVCDGGIPTTLYGTGDPRIAGMHIYIDAGLTTPYTGFSYLIDVTNGNHIFTINPVTGVIGYDVGTSCP